MAESLSEMAREPEDNATGDGAAWEFDSPVVEAEVDHAEKRESAGCVIGMGLGLGTIAASLAIVVGLLVFGGAVPAEWLALMTGGEGLVVEEKVASIFSDGVAPFGLELTSATSFPTGEIVIRLERPSEDEPVPSDTPASPDTGETPDSNETPDSGDVAESNGPNDPDEIVLIQFRTSDAAAALFEREVDPGAGFGARRKGGDAVREASARLLAWERDPSFQWHTTIESDEIEWSRWRADYRIERSFREGGEFRDSIRFNLSQRTRNLVLFALWPVDVVASKADALRVVRKVSMLAPEAGPTFEKLKLESGS